MNKPTVDAKFWRGVLVSAALMLALVVVALLIAQAVSR